MDEEKDLEVKMLETEQAQEEELQTLE